MNADSLIMDQGISSFSSKDEEIQYWKDLAVQFQSGLVIYIFISVIT
jgi:hypothetical protein